MFRIRSLAQQHPRLVRFADGFIYTLILYSILVFAIETLPDSKRYGTFFQWSEYVVVAIFSIEYVLRVSSQGWRYIRSFYGLVDLVAILPFFVSLGTINAHTLRAIRLLRLLRITKLTRYSRALHRLKAAFLDVRDELAAFCFLTLLLLFLASTGIYYCEHEAQPETFKSIFHALWWAVCTLTTVGYGDVYPVTTIGKLLTGFILILGLGVVSIPSGLLASALVKRQQIGRPGEAEATRLAVSHSPPDGL